MLTVGLIIFWPALIGMAATTDRREELARLRGEYEAVEASMREKQCPTPIPSPANPPASPAPQPPNT
jgi:hypothetical protein